LEFVFDIISSKFDRKERIIVGNSTRKKERVGNYSSKVEEIKKIEFCLLNLNEDLKFDIIRHIIMTDATTFHNIYEEIEILKLDNSEWNLLLFRH
jgi:hypothetical protein